MDPEGRRRDREQIPRREENETTNYKQIKPQIITQIITDHPAQMARTVREEERCVQATDGLTDRSIEPASDGGGQSVELTVVPAIAVRPVFYQLMSAVAVAVAVEVEQTVR